MSENITNSSTPPNSFNLSGKRWVYWVNEFQTPHPELGYIPSIVVEDTPGHRLLAGNPEELQEPWYWGGLARARQIAAEKNAARGYTERQVEEIIGSSILADWRSESTS